VNITLNATAATQTAHDISRSVFVSENISRNESIPEDISRISSVRESEDMARNNSSCASQEMSRLRMSEILRSILTKNPGVKSFSVKRILKSIGHDRFEASLMMFSLPAIVPVRGPKGFVTVPTGTIATQLISGQKQIKLPRFILRKCVSRRSLAVAIHAVLPILEAAERVVRPRWSWVNHAYSRRVLGLFVFLLAIGIAYPLMGFNALHATSIFVIALGMAEQDGLAVMVGVAAGVVSLALLATSGVSVRALRARAGKFFRKIGRKLGLAAVARGLETRGYTRLANLLTFEWSELLLMWDPEKPAVDGTQPPPPRPAARASRAALADPVRRARRSSAARASLRRRTPACPDPSRAARRSSPC